MLCIGKETSMKEFWETNKGSYFYQKQFPALIESINRLAKANEELNDTIQEQNSMLKMSLEQMAERQKKD